MNNEDGNGQRAADRGLPVWGGRRNFSLDDNEALAMQALKAEQSVLGSLLLDHERTVTDEIFHLLHAEEFFRAAHQTIYTKMQAMHSRGAPIDAVTLPEEFTSEEYEIMGGDDYLDDLVRATPAPLNGPQYADIVKQNASARRAEEALREGLKTVRAGSPPDEALAQTIDKLTRIEAAASVDVADADESENLTLPRMGDAAFRGLVGDLVACIEPETEACREAILIQLLVALGSIVGPGPHFWVGPTKHRSNLYTCLVGPTGCGKGMAFDAVEWAIRTASAAFFANPFLTGMTSGEGLIMEAKEVGGQVLAVETEFARTIGNMNRDGNCLDSVLRQGFESETLRNATKNNPLTAEGVHLSVIAHAPPNELKAKLSSNSVDNGFAGRFLWCGVYMAKPLPKGGDFDAVKRSLDPYFTRLIRAVDKAKGMVKPFRRDAEADALWEEVYWPLRVRPVSAYGSATSKAAALAARLSMIYAWLDHSSPEIRRPQLESALAVWDYCNQTAMTIFGVGVNDRRMGKLLAALEQAPDGLDRRAVYKILGGHVKKNELDALLSAAQSAGQILYTKTCTKDSVWMHRKYKRD